MLVEMHMWRCADYMFGTRDRCTNFAKYDTLEILAGTETEGIEISAAHVLLFMTVTLQRVIFVSFLIFVYDIIFYLTYFYIVYVCYYILLLYWILYMWYNINIWIDLHVCCTTSFSQDDSGLAEAGQWTVLAQHLSHCVLWVTPPAPKEDRILIISNIARAGLTGMTKWTLSDISKLIKTIHSYQTVFTCRCMVAMVTLYHLVISHIYSLVSS